MLEHTFIRFLAVGIGNTALGLTVIFSLRPFCSDFTANLAGYCIVVPISFLTHRNVSFRDDGGYRGALARYVPTLLVGYATNSAILWGLLRDGASPYLAQTAAITGHVVVTYLLSRFFVFLSPKTQI